METANISNERTPLLGNGATSNGHGHQIRIATLSNEQTLLDANSATNGQMPSVGQGTSSDLDTGKLIVSCPKTPEQKTNEVSLEEVAQALCSAWERNRHQRHKYYGGDCFYYLSTKELYAMHLAWKNVTSGRSCCFPTHTIAEAVAEAIAKAVQPPSSEPEFINCLVYLGTDQCTLAVCLLREWQRITEGVGFPVRYIETVVENPDEQQPVASKFWIRQVELYDKAHGFIFNRLFQCILHSLLIIWPISILIVGSKYTDCPASHTLSYLLISLGCVGCLAIFIRLALMHLKMYTKNSYDWFREWIGLRLIEFIFLIVFIVQAFHFFSTYPITEPGLDQCVQDFYNAALVINYVSISFVSGYVFVYFVIICANQLDFWHWIFRHL